MNKRMDWNDLHDEMTKIANNGTLEDERKRQVAEDAIIEALAASNLSFRDTEVVLKGVMNALALAKDSFTNNCPVGSVLRSRKTCVIGG